MGALRDSNATCRQKFSWACASGVQRTQSDQNLANMTDRGACSQLIMWRIFIANKATMDLSMSLAALWQQVEIDQIKPITDATNLAGTAEGSRSADDCSFRIAALIFFALDLETRKVNDDRSTIVPRVFMECLGKKEHFSIWRDNPRLADS